MTMMGDVTLLDGGMGQELIRRSGHTPTPAWSAKVMFDAPKLVGEVHREFIRAGAEVIILNSYSATPRRLARVGLEDAFERLQAAAIDIAHAAIAAEARSVRLAGCLPPLVVSYQAERFPGFEIGLGEYREIVAQQAGRVDLFLCETMGSIAEARAATTAAAETGLPVWTALTVDDTDGSRLRSGEPVNEGAAAAVEAGASAVLVNCSKPEAVSTALPQLGVDAPYGGYANGFHTVAPLALDGTVKGLTAREDLGPEAYADIAMGWVAGGARLVGGCCEVGPAHIAELARRLGKRGSLDAAVTATLEA